MNKSASPLLLLTGETEYQDHYNENFCRKPLSFATSTGVASVFFDRNTFGHAFYESRQRNGQKDEFSPERASRMPFIREVLADAQFERFAGWDKSAYRHDHARCVTIAADDFVVVIRLGLTATGSIRGRFVTCYVADNSIGKIRSGPQWNETECLRLLQAKKKDADSHTRAQRPRPR